MRLQSAVQLPCKSMQIQSNPPCNSPRMITDRVPLILPLIRLQNVKLYTCDLSRSSNGARKWSPLGSGDHLHPQDENMDSQAILLHNGSGRMRLEDQRRADAAGMWNGGGTMPGFKMEVQGESSGDSGGGWNPSAPLTSTSLT